MKVLVIGGTMFIGRLLVAELLKAGHDVTVLHRRPKHDLGKRVQNLVADRNDAASVRNALRFSSFQVVFDNVYDWERGTTAAHVEGTVQAVMAASGSRLASSSESPILCRGALVNFGFSSRCIALMTSMASASLRRIAA